MAHILAISFELRLLILFVVGCALGCLCNWAIYSLAYNRRAFSPWSRPLANSPPRRWSDVLPVVGWLGLRREESLHGSGFWIRPLIVELLVGFLLVGLYAWEIGEMGLLPEGARRAAVRPLADEMLHANFLAHALLILFMIVASLIDADEKIIPDEVTIPGTIVGLLVMALLPEARLPEETELAAPAGLVKGLRNITLASPNDWPPVLDGSTGLFIALACYLIWCFALLPRSWRTRHGLRRAVAVFTARIVREPVTLLIAVLALAGIVGITLVWSIGGMRWESLLSALVGLAAGGGIVWLVRIIGRYALRKEAMGFGDVTLMAMIGAYLGWQGCLFVFFIAPFAGLLLGVAQWVAHREDELPYGPFLCLAALLVVVQWSGIWGWASPFFGIPWLVPGALAVCMALMVPMLSVVRWMRGG